MVGATSFRAVANGLHCFVSGSVYSFDSRRKHFGAPRFHRGSIHSTTEQLLHSFVGCHGHVDRFVLYFFFCFTN